MKKILLFSLIALGTVANAQCEPTNTFPFMHDFTSATPPNLPNCTLESNTGESQGWNSWSSDGNYGWAAGDKAITNYLDAGKTDNAWFFTRAFTLTGGQAYTINYKVGVTNVNNSRVLKITYGPNQSSTGMITANTVSTLDGTYEKAAVFTPATTGTYYLGFNTTGGGDATWCSVILDNIKISEGNLAVSDVNGKSKITVFPNPVKDVLKLSNISGVKSITVSDMTGRQVKTLVPSNEINLSSLKAGNYVVSLIMENGSIQTINTIKK